MTDQPAKPFELRFSYDGREVLKLTERNVDSPRFSETAAEIPMFAASLHSDQPGLLRLVRPGQTVEAWTHVRIGAPMTQVVVARVDHVKYDSDKLRESMQIQARSRAGLVVDRGCDASLTDTLADVIARIGAPDECLLEGIDGQRRVSAHIRVGSSYAALRALAVSLGAAVVHRVDGTLAVIPTAPLAAILPRAPVARIGEADVLGMHYELGHAITRR